ncbi:Kelch repeat-containing protein [Dokdonia sinensis]|uniref:Kelch repeat-containing protein n=1 Tax=Dokdonia sinensis TaxID=2479847 RepID=UPI001374E536|nr:DUF5060 domain-containing protein [Dokdonia sinensis]
MRIFSILCILTFFISSCSQNTPENWNWETMEATGAPTARHEAGMVGYKDQLILMGGRRINPTSVFNTKTNTWTQKAETPIELHHFQPVVIDDAVYIVGAMTGQWPNETPVDRVIIYYPEKDEYVHSHDIPEARRRGGAGATVYNGKIYLAGGITKGHMNGYVPWLDVYDPKTGKWEILPDAPQARDHFQAVTVNDMLYAFAGRTTSKITEQDMALTVAHGDRFDLKNNKWLPVINATKIPTERAGNMAIVWNDEVIIGGGESTAHVVAHNETEVYNPKTQQWSLWPTLNQGRHGTGFAIIGDYLYTASGCGNRGGEPELTTVERLELPKGNAEPISTTINKTPVHKQFHSLELSFNGPETSEDAPDNPFLNYKLEVTFKNEKQSQIIRGFYATDGNASETSATSGNVWKVRFNPQSVGEYSYEARLCKGDSIALKEPSDVTEQIPLKENTGAFTVVRSDKEGANFNSHGILEMEEGFFRFRENLPRINFGGGKHFIKTGANSPENLLAYVDFDDTYRIKAEAREGEAEAPEAIHTFSPHLNDWKNGDPSWKNGKGKAIIGAMNYLASKGMNSSYFLTLNILGDGKDVWPYLTPDDFTRFDVSKLEQWEILFEHMQSQGILLHLVVQETENETMLDNGETGPFRQLYFQELIARFGHHNGLVWNLGEENGPAPWTPVGQNDAQRKAMASYLKANDPYKHPVLLHTHSYDPLRSDILNDIVGDKNIDGLSLQQADRKKAGVIIAEWKEKSRKAGAPWGITMDEIGEWHTAVLPDSIDAHHNTIRHYAMWGTLLSGGAGLEWYFGAKYPSNDLTSEDWRKRDNLWTLTNHARLFFENYLPYWEMHPNHNLINTSEAYSLVKENEIYVTYLPKFGQHTLNLEDATGTFKVHWYSPVSGGELQNGSVTTIQGGTIQSLGNPPNEKRSSGSYEDWVVLVRKEN